MIATSVSKTRPDNTTAYDVNDTIGTDPATNWEFTFEKAGGKYRIDSATLRINADTLPAGLGSCDLHLFNAAPTAITDNVAWAGIDADKAKYIGMITFPTPVDKGGFLFAEVDNLDKYVQLASGSATLYGQVQTLAGFTPAALIVVTITLRKVLIL